MGSFGIEALVPVNSSNEHSQWVQKAEIHAYRQLDGAAWLKFGEGSVEVCRDVAKVDLRKQVHKVRLN